MKRSINIKTVAKILGLEFIGDETIIDGVGLCNRNTEFKSILSFATDHSFLQMAVHKDWISCMVITRESYQCIDDEERQYFKGIILSENPEVDFYRLNDYLIDYTDFYAEEMDRIEIGENCIIHPTARLDKGITIGNNVCIGANTEIHKGTTIEDCVIIGANCIIGDDGFQIIRSKGENIRIRHCGHVHIGEKSYIKNAVVIDKSLFEGNTHIGRNVMIDDMAYIGHNCYLGDHAVITAGTVLCGSSTVEESAWVGSNSTVLNKKVVCKNALVGIGSVVTRDIDEGAIAYGVPARVKNECG